jgi:hypothetical protein
VLWGDATKVRAIQFPYRLSEILGEGDPVNV